MFCQKCGTENKVGVNFCKQCGEKLVSSQHDSKIESGFVSSVEKKSKQDETYAGFRIRLGAYLIDLIGICIIEFLIGFGGVTLFGNGFTEFLKSSTFTLFSYSIFVIYPVFFLIFWSTTPGKYLYGLRIQAENGGNVNFLQSLLRSLLELLSIGLIFTGYLDMNNNSKRQAWHDRKAHTVVFQRKLDSYIVPVILSIIGLIIYFYLYSLGSKTS